MKIRNMIWSLMLLSFIFTSCDKIDAPFTEEVVKPTTNKKVLLEDYTGQRCVNCPAAHEIAHQLQDAFGEENLIVVAVHAGFFADPVSAPFDYDFRTTAGTEYESYFSVQTYPTGMVDRVNTGGNYLIDKDGWSTQIAQQFEESALINIEIDNSLSGNSLSGEINLEFIDELSTQAQLQIWIIEDNIVKPQVIPGGLDEEYVQMHVLRGAINGSWGQALPATTYSAESTESISFSNFQLGDDWVPENLSLVAFVYDQESKKVIQVEKKKILEIVE